METLTKQKTDHLDKFANFLLEHESIDGYINNGQLKETFGRLGKKAFKELAEFLGLKEYDVNFNKAGDAISGDLRLMGMFAPGKGIYISLNKDGVMGGVLYRSIKHMKDYTGGGNNYFQEDEFLWPENIKSHVFNLLKLDGTAENFPASFADTAKENIPEEKTVSRINPGEDDKAKKAVQVKELYDKISEGKHIERLPELLNYLKDRELKKALEMWGTDMYELITAAPFREKLRTNLWNLIPEEYKKLRTIKPIQWEADPADKGVQQLVADFLSRDVLKSAQLGVNFDSQGIVATDSNKLIFLNKVRPKKKGIYCITKFCFKALGKEGQEEVIIRDKFPDYAAILPKEVNVIRTVSTEKLRLFCNTLLSAGMTDKRKLRGIIRYDDTLFILVNLSFLLSCAEAFSRLGYESLDMGFTASDKVILIAPQGKIPDISKLTTPFILLMPLLPDGYYDREGKDYIPQQGELYLDALHEQVDTYGITQGGKESTGGKSITRESSIDLLKGDHWFKENPGKILGEEYQATDRFGKPVTKVKGTIENIIQGIDVPSVSVPHEETEALETEINEPLDQLLSDKVKSDNMDRVIHQTQKDHAEKALRKLSGESEKEGDCPEETFCFDAIMKQYNKGISDEEIKAWIWYKRKNNSFNDENVILNKKNGWSKYVIPLAETAKYTDKWLKEGILCYYDGGYMPSVLYYAENIYQRQSFLLREKSTIISNYGQEQFDRQWKGLENIKPPKLTLADPIVENRLFIKPDSAFAKEIKISHLTDGTSFKVYVKELLKYVEGETTLADAFKTWLRALPKNEFKKSNDWDIISFYLEGRSPGRHYDKEEKLRLKQNAKMEGDTFFIRFLADALTRDDQQKIEHLWNTKYNGYVEINYFKVPVAFTSSATFKNKPLFIRQTQREGIGFISVHGSGCIAYDVGVGKTMTAILALGQALESGQCKRPFIVVPNQTYKNWLGEIKGVVDKGKVLLTGLLPQYQVIDLYNLGTDYIDQLRGENGEMNQVPEYSISVMTYEGFNRLGFNDATWKSIGNELYDILNQGTEQKREQEKLFEKIDEMMGKGIKGGSVNIEDLGFDYMVVDEAHAMKKSFTQVKGEVEGDDAQRSKSTYKIQSGQPSMTALRGFMISQYILRTNQMRNVLLLTATPFTNSPLEIYSILALIGYQALEKSGIKNIKEFFDTFIKTSMELIINAKLKPQRKEIVLGFNNLIALQQLIFKFITYKTGEDAKIQRPNKIVLPLLNKRVGDKIIPLPSEEQISTNLPMTPTQKDYMRDVELYVTGKTSLTNFCVNASGYEENEEGEEGFSEALDEKNLSEEEEEGTRILRGMSFARQLALSPYLYACNPDKRPSYAEYIESSPKLKYVMECIRSVKHYHEERDEEVSGQVIYMNSGVHFFPLIKEYLVQKVGYKESEIGIIKGGLSPAKKEGIKERFLAGDVKIIIGSATIKEGINLQNKSTVLYNCWLDWNPTDVKQLEGRIWRFGNQYANVRIVNPMMEDSIDTFIFQKLEEKTSRINEIWYRAGKTNALNLEEFNPSELKMGLITDPNALAELLMMEERERSQDELNGLRNQKDVLKTLDEHRTVYNSNYPHVKKIADKYSPSKEGKARAVETLFKIYKDYLEDENSGSTYLDENIYDKVRKSYAAVKRGIEQVLEPRGLDINFKLEDVTKHLEKEMEEKQKIMDETTGEKGVKAKAEEIIADRVKKGYKPKTVAERVEEFTRLNPRLLSEMMVYDNSEEAKEKKSRQIKHGEELEASSDAVDELEALVRDMEEMDQILSELEELQKAA